MDYDKMSLLTLRNYARDLGVKCPTKYKKNNLIEEIEKILQGETQPYRTKKGRPPKTETVDSLIKKEEEKNEDDKIEIKIQNACNMFKNEMADEIDRFQKKILRLIGKYNKKKRR